MFKTEGVRGGAAAILAAVPYFEHLNAALIEAVAEAAVRREYGAGELVFLEGERNAGLYIVEQGWLKSIKSLATGREQILRFVGPGDVFNEIGCLASSTNQASVIALEPSAVWIVQGNALLRLMERYPPLARAITQNLAERVLHLMLLVEDLSLRSVESRLARLILQQSQKRPLHRRPWATQAEMAARIGTVPDVLNRALRTLVEEGLIRVDRHRIEIVDPQGLKERALLAN